MANFKSHMIGATAVSITSAGLIIQLHLTTYGESIALILMGIIGGMLPDIDAGNSKPVRLLFNCLAFLAAIIIMHLLELRMESYQVIIMGLFIFLWVRYGVFRVFNRLTQHRGIFHSLLAMIFFALLTTYISYQWLSGKLLQAWLNGLFISLGFIVHLLLDEFHSVDLTNRRIKKSFGTAFKLLNYQSPVSSAIMILLTALLYFLAPSPITLLDKINISKINPF